MVNQADSNTPILIYYTEQTKPVFFLKLLGPLDPSIPRESNYPGTENVPRTK